MSKTDDPLRHLDHPPPHLPVRSVCSGDVCDELHQRKKTRSMNLKYTFNGEEHEMSAAEAMAIEALGTKDIPQSGPRLTLFEAAAIMRLRPGQTDPRDAETLRYSKGDIGNMHWHIDRGGCTYKTDRTLHYPQFRSMYANTTGGCCGNCVNMLRRAGDKNFGAQNNERFAQLRNRHTEKAEHARRSLADRMDVIVSRVKKQTMPGQRRLSDAELMRMEKQHRDNLSTASGDKAFEWGVNVSQVHGWKKKGIISGPVGRIWNYHSKPAMIGKQVDRETNMLIRRGAAQEIRKFGSAGSGPKSVLYSDGDRY